MTMRGVPVYHKIMKKSFSSGLKIDLSRNLGVKVIKKIWKGRRLGDFIGCEEGAWTNLDGLVGVVVEGPTWHKQHNIYKEKFKGIGRLGKTLRGFRISIYSESG